MRARRKQFSSCDTRIIVAAHGKLSPADIGLLNRALCHAHPIATFVFERNQLVDKTRGWNARTGNHRGAHAIVVDGCRSQRRNRVLVQVVGDGDLGFGCAERVEQSSHTANFNT